MQSLHIKTSTSISLPIWTCDLGAEAGGRWDGLVAEDVEMSGSESESEEEVGEDKEMAVEKAEAVVEEVKAARKGKKRPCKNDSSCV